MVKILVDTTAIRDKPSGIGIYTINLIKALYSLQKEENIDLGIYYQLSLKNLLKGNFSVPKILKKYQPCYTLPLPVTITNILGKYNNPILNYFDQYLDKPDIIQGTDHFVYPCRSAKKIMTIHDLSFIKHPEYAPKIVKNTYQNRIAKCLQWTDLIITFSQSTKQDIIDIFQINENKIFITKQSSRYEDINLNHLEQSQVKYNFNDPYLLFVSTFEPRKNIINIIRAFEYLKKTKKIEHNLILIGKKGWQYQVIFEAINSSPFCQDIYYLGYLTDEQVALFYQKADVFIYPSFYEGFGLPVLEAMNLGAPVITSNNSSLPEVAGDAAIFINPHNYHELADAILQVVSNYQLRQDLIARGKNRAKLFSWKNTAQQTINTYKYLLN
jgi:glycosyltransferase involved in cell wall biosynthesis